MSGGHGIISVKAKHSEEGINKKLRCACTKAASYWSFSIRPKAVGGRGSPAVNTIKEWVFNEDADPAADCISFFQHFADCLCWHDDFHEPAVCAVPVR